MLFAFKMAYVGHGDEVRGMLEIMVFEVAREVKVGLLRHSVVDKETARSSADGHAAHHGVHNRPYSEHGEPQTGLDLLQTRLGGKRVGERSYHSRTDVGRRLPFEGTQNGAVFEPQQAGQHTVHPLFEIVEVGMGGIDGDIVADEFVDEAPEEGVGSDAFHAAEDKGVMGGYEVGVEADGLLNHLGGEVEGGEHPAAFAGGVAQKKPRVVVTLLIFRVQTKVEVVGYFFNLHEA